MQFDAREGLKRGSAAGVLYAATGPKLSVTLANLRGTVSTSRNEPTSANFRQYAGG